MDYKSLLLLLALAATVCSVRSKCPSKEDIYPCTCRVDILTADILLRCQDRTTTLTELRSALSHFSEDEEITRIELRFLDFGTLPSNLFDGLVVKELYFYKCEIDFEDGKLPFKGLEFSLEYLTIKSSLTQKDGPLNLKFGHLEELRALKLSNNEITELGDDLFKIGRPSKLQRLEIIDNGIEKIGEKVFEKIKSLKYFDLSGNKFGPIRRNMIPTSADHLEDIRLVNNGIFDLPTDIFTSLPSLQSIDLEENNIRTLDRSTWENIVKQVSYIYLSDNPIQCDSDMEWLFGKELSYHFYGQCVGPAGKEGLFLERFIREGKK